MTWFTKPLTGSRDIIAPSQVRCRCGNEFCFSCLDAAHAPSTCTQVRDWNKRDKGADATLDKIPDSLKEKIKKCPNCGTLLGGRRCNLPA